MEIKKYKLGFKDIYQAKRYAEVLDTDFAFLISPNRFSIQALNYLDSHRFMLEYGFSGLDMSHSGPGLTTIDKKHIFVMIYEDNTLRFEDRIKQPDPFARSRFEFF